MKPKQTPSKPVAEPPQPPAQPPGGMDLWTVLSEPPPGLKVSIELLLWVLQVSYREHGIDTIKDLQTLGRLQGMRAIANMLMERYRKDNNLQHKDLPHVLLQSQSSRSGYLTGTTGPSGS